MNPKLLLIPKRYKVGKLYSQIGNDLTVVRNLAASFRNASGLLEFAAPNVPRIEFPEGGGCPYLLREGESRNLLLRSNDFANANWIKDSTSLTSGIVSPTGATNAVKLVEQASNAVHSVYQTLSSLPSSRYSVSFFVKKAERFKCSIADRNTGGYVAFDLNLGTVLDSLLFSGSVEVYANDWLRLTATSNSALTVIVPQCFILPDSYTTGVPITLPYLGDGTSGIFIYGAQTESGIMPTSYIETLGTAVTRPADDITAPDMAGATVNTFVFSDGTQTEPPASGTITVPVGKIAYLKQD